MPFVLSFSGRQHECGECKCRSSRWLADGQDSQRGQSWFASECSSLPSQNMGRVVSSDEIRHATGTSEWARRLRELRDEFGYAILTCADETRAKSRGISKASLFKHPIIERLLLQIQRVRLLERVPVWQTRVSATSRLCQLLCPPNRQMGTGAHSQPHARITTKLFCLSGNVENRRVVLTIPPALGAGGLPVQVRAPRPIFIFSLRASRKTISVTIGKFDGDLLQPCGPHSRCSTSWICSARFFFSRSIAFAL